MILTKEVTIKINISNRDYFHSIGFENLKIKELIIVPVEKLMKKSHIKILVKCDNCEKEKHIDFNTHKTPYYCKDCGGVRNKMLKIEKYGFTYVNSEKGTKTKLEKYGTLDMSEQIKISVQKKYGVDNVFQLEEVKNKLKNTNLEKYGFEYVCQNKEIKEKIKDTNNNRYGGTLMGSKIIKEKISKIILEKYGVEFISQNDEIKKKKEKTGIKNCGFPYHLSTDAFKLSQGFLLDKDMIKDFRLYHKQSRRIFRKIKLDVYKNWEGYDYYDNEYIKDNFNLHYNDKNYPTVDHKISVYYGFINNISVEEINKIENLVVTKRTNNSSKGK